MRQLESIYTITAKCRSCYHCVRVCPVKAISVVEGLAMVEERLCIKCAVCVRECPQHAKVVRSDVEDAKELIESGRVVAASVDPAFAAMFSGRLALNFPSALRMLGFSYVRESAEAMKYITDKSFDENQKGRLSSACTSMVNYAEKYKPDILPLLVNCVTPMVAHGRMLKKDYPGCAVIYIGPCAAKKSEIRKKEYKDAVDLVLTFSEVISWLEEKEILLEDCMESMFENKYEIGDARLFPIRGGMLKTAGKPDSGFGRDYISLSGNSTVIKFFKEKEVYSKYQFVEASICGGGCIGSHDFRGEKNVFVRREEIIDFFNIPHVEMHNEIEVEHKAKYENLNVITNEVTENQINKVYERTGKVEERFRLNCGACGYSTCRDYAQAVVSGMAEIEMCIPYMRGLAQQRTDIIIETIPNGIVILDSELCIIKMNPAFQKMFMCNNGILGRRISYLVDAEGYEALMSGHVEIYEAMKSKHNVKYHEILYPLKEEKQYVGIYVDVSKLQYNEKQLDVVKTQTLKHAQEFLEHQVSFAQEMAHYLGKSTAKSEEIAKRLIGLYEGNSDGSK